MATAEGDTLGDRLGVGGGEGVFFGLGECEGRGDGLGETLGDGDCVEGTGDAQGAADARTVHDHDRNVDLAHGAALARR